VHDTIVIFDRVRENVHERQRNEPFPVTAERSLQETIVRSFNTSFATLLPLFALFFFGGESIKWFVLALIVGIILGTYSSIFLATPLLVVWKKER
jgi:preprotein translocase SecF subunit